MAMQHVLRGNRVQKQRAIALAIASFAFLAGPSYATTEIALRFFDDNPAAKGVALSATAQAAIEKAAGHPLIAAGRDGDGAFRFRFSSEPSGSDVRAALNRLRNTGAVVYANLASDERGRIAKQAMPTASPAISATAKRVPSAVANARSTIACAASTVEVRSGPR